MEALYHQTNQLIQETSALFQRLEKDPLNYESIESAIQSKIHAVNANCEKLDVFVFKTPINQRSMAKMRVDQLKYDNKHIQASLISSQNRRLRREQEISDREQLLSRRFGHDHTAINVDYLAQEQVSLQNSHRNVDEMIHTGCPIHSLKYQSGSSSHSGKFAKQPVISCLRVRNIVRQAERRSYKLLSSVVIYGDSLVILRQNFTELTIPYIEHARHKLKMYPRI